MATRSAGLCVDYFFEIAAESVADNGTLTIESFCLPSNWGYVFPVSSVSVLIISGAYFTGSFSSTLLHCLPNKFSDK